MALTPRPRTSRGPDQRPRRNGGCRNRWFCRGENLGFALGYNGLGIPVAAGVLYPAWHILLSPMIAGAAMAFSSLSVVLNANRLHAFDPTRAKPRHTTGRLAPVTIDEQALAKPAAGIGRVGLRISHRCVGDAVDVLHGTFKPPETAAGHICHMCFGGRLRIIRGHGAHASSTSRRSPSRRQTTPPQRKDTP